MPTEKGEKRSDRRNYRRRNWIKNGASIILANGVKMVSQPITA